jgi:hypothetical protein
MRHILTSFLAFHWTAIFALLAAVSAGEADGTMPAVFFDLVGNSAVESTIAAVWAKAIFSTGFCIVAALFLWVFFSAAFGDGTVSEDTEEVARFAFGAAVGSLTGLLVLRSAEPGAPLFTEVAALVAALLASYLAVFAERWSGLISTLPSRDELRDAAKLMAAGAAYNSLLSRFSGRPDSNFGEGR